MTVIINGTTGITDVDGSASTPAITGADTNTGIFFPAADTIAFSEGGAEVMRIDSNGNVGIGTASPGYTLDVVGSSRVYSSTAGLNTAKFGASRAGDYVFLDGLCSPLASNGYSIFGMRAYSSLASAGVQVGGSEWVHEGAGTDNKSYYTISTHSGTALAERMRIDSSGQLLLGATSFTSNAANFTSGSMYANGNIFVNNSSGTAGYNVRLDGFSNNFYVVWNNGAGTDNNSIYYAYGGTAWVNSSDETLKDIIEPITDAANKVSTLRAVIGKLKTEEEGTRHAYLIAQDVQKVLPEAVYTNKSRVEGEPDTLGVGYTDVIPLLVAAIKELKALTDTQASTITTLTDRITALETP